MADTKITSLPAQSGTILGTDIFPMVDDPSGTPLTTQATFTQLKTFVNNGQVIPATSDGDILTTNNTKTIANKSISGSSNTFTNLPNSALSSGIDALKIGSGAVSNAVFGYLAGATSNIQNQINSILSAINIYKGTLTVISDSGTKQAVISEEDIQGAIGVDKDLAHSISFENLIVQADEETSSNSWDTQTDIEKKTTTDNSVLHINELVVTTTSGSMKTKVRIICSIIDAS